MPTILPSQVVAFIDSAYPSSKQDPNAAFVLSIHDTSSVQALLDLVRDIPHDLLNALDPGDYLRLSASLASLNAALPLWSRQGGAYELRKVRGLGEANPISMVREVLSKCPDEVPPEDTADLTFISDHELRLSVRLDVGEAYRASASGSWKAATVLAGAAIEALLLWKLSSMPEQSVHDLVNHSRSGGRLHQHNRLTEYTLLELVTIAVKVGAIKEVTSKACDLARDFRNLIHPGRSQRLQMKCDKATAYSALAALEHVVRDLSSAT